MTIQTAVPATASDWRQSQPTVTSGQHPVVVAFRVWSILGRDVGRAAEVIATPTPDGTVYRWIAKAPGGGGIGGGEAKDEAEAQFRANLALLKLPTPYVLHAQDSWLKLCEEHGETEARRLVVAKLRGFIEAVEAGGEPDVYGAELESPGQPPCCGTSPVEAITVCLSRPWGG